MGKRHTLVHQISDWAERKGDTPALYEKDASGDFRHITWAEYWTSVRDIAKGLIAIGHEVGDCVAIVGDNRIAWVLCQFGIMAARGVPAPIYTTNTLSQVAYIVDHCKGKIAICDKALQLEKYLEAEGNGDIQVDKIVVMDDQKSDDDKILDLSRLVELGRQQSDDELDKRLDELTEDETALLIYTSGTTGTPKAVQLTHRGMGVVGDGLASRFDFLEEEGSYRSLSYLPLCHVAEQIFTNIASLNNGGVVYFCPDIKLMGEYLPQVKPTVFLGVPRVWEKFEAKLRAGLADAPFLKKKIANWATKTELAAFKKEIESGQPVDSWGRRKANKMVITKIKEKLGLTELTLAATGAAPLNVSTQEFFASLGIVIYEGYGMSETSGVATVSDAKRPVFGAVGKPLDGVEIKIADDDEVLLKGPNMTAGYLHMPEKTAELLDSDGWLHTGDLGTIGDDGNLRITGRKKDLIITAGGKNVAPAEMEAHLKTIPGIGQAVVVGDRQPYLCALLVLDPEDLPGLCEKLGISNGSVETVAKNPTVVDFVSKEVESSCNARVARYQTIKKFEILPLEFSVEGGELTPTLKIKRNVVNDKYADVIDGFYS